MLGPELVNAASRIGPVQAENRPVWVQTPVAQQLGLRDGQIVQATVEVRDQRVRLWVKDFSFELPNGWVLKDGDKPFLRVMHNASSWGFLIQAYPNGQAPVATPIPVNQLFGVQTSLA
jgi:anaerobic selenocysteine-containing dehydrogenase